MLACHNIRDVGGGFARVVAKAFLDGCYVAASWLKVFSHIIMSIIHKS